MDLQILQNIKCHTLYNSPSTFVPSFSIAHRCYPIHPRMNRLASLVIILQLLVATHSFVISPSKSYRILAASSEEEPDLFEYFDPLLSPHAYPDGIAPDIKPTILKSEQPKGETSSQDELIGLASSEWAAMSYGPSTGSPEQGAPAASPDFFDPLLSPHMYPNGTPDKVVLDQSSTAPKQETPDPDFFDPRLSPHMYPNGTPDHFVGEDAPKKRRVGVLLMDHGSRNKGSNDRLHEVARIYQESVDKHQVVVGAAHMELASPSIPEALQALLEQGVEEIVCHPYFLSAKGRHVSEDIPEIIGGAIESLGIDMPVVITEPVGSQTNIMIGAIQSLVQQNSNILKSN